MTERGKPLICPHGREIGVVIDPAEFSPGADYIVHKITMPVCELCLLEAIGLNHGEKDQPR